MMTPDRLDSTESLAASGATIGRSASGRSSVLTAGALEPLLHPTRISAAARRVFMARTLPRPDPRLALQRRFYETPAAQPALSVRRGHVPKSCSAGRHALSGIDGPRRPDHGLRERHERVGAHGDRG